MALDLVGIGKAAESVKGILGMFFADKTEEEKARIAAAFAVIQSQNDINRVEAASPSFWVSGWRPGVGWVCVASLGMVYIPKALVLTAIWTYQSYVVISAWNGTGQVTLPVYPDLGVTDLLGLLGSILGIGAFRTAEKLKDKA